MRSACLLSVFAVLSAGQSVAWPGEGASIPAGTPVPLVLMRRLSSGGAPVGSEVPFMVAEDVKAATGQVVIKQGTLAVGKVVQSKGLGMLSLPGNHARLNVKLVRTWAADGKEIPLCSDAAHAESAYEFTRDNTGKPETIPQLDKLWADAAMRDLLSQATSELGQRHAATWSSDPHKREELAKALRELELSHAGDAMKADALAEVYATLDVLRKTTQPANPVTALTMGAALEMAKLADNVQSRVGGALKRRNIVAHVGTPVRAVTAKAVTIGGAVPSYAVRG